MSKTDPKTIVPLAGLETEWRDPKFRDLAKLPNADVLSTLLAGQQRAIDAVEIALPAIDQAVVLAKQRLTAGQGRLIYAGAGTSGRLGMLDGVELRPTFNWPPERLLVLLAGGNKAIKTAVEGAEDSAKAARLATQKAKITKNDVVIGLAASGTTPFTRAIIKSARKHGALTIALANNPGSPLLADAEVGVFLATGAEVLAGSTRLAAGTSQKVALNLFSTCLMVAMHKVHDGYMVDMVASNDKLRQRAVKMICAITGCNESVATGAILACDSNIKAAILNVQGVTPKGALELLQQTQGNLDQALNKIR